MIPVEAQHLYDMYDYHISGDINGQNIWTLLKVIEDTYQVDTIKLADGTRLWNVLRVFFYTFHHEQTGKRNLNKLFFISEMSLKSVYHQVLHKHCVVEGEDVLRDIVHYLSSVTGVDEQQLTIDAFSYITIFSDMKEYYREQLLRSNVTEVVLSCGYGRLPMAKAQACRELGVKCIEEQHGVITRYLIAYRKALSSKNHDGVPEYFHAFDEDSARLVREGGLFDADKVIVKGYPTIDRYVLFTGQWTLVDETRAFLTGVAEILDDDIVLLFKPHPFDDNNYDDLERMGIILVDKDEDVKIFLRGVDVHATVYSTCGIDASMMNIPSVFVDVCHLMQPVGMVVDSPDLFVKKIKELIR